MAVFNLESVAKREPIRVEDGDRVRSTAGAGQGSYRLE